VGEPLPVHYQEVPPQEGSLPASNTSRKDICAWPVILNVALKLPSERPLTGFISVRDTRVLECMAWFVVQKAVQGRVCLVRQLSRHVAAANDFLLCGGILGVIGEQWRHYLRDPSPEWVSYQFFIRVLDIRDGRVQRFGDTFGLLECVEANAHQIADLLNVSRKVLNTTLSFNQVLALARS
jgi:hypothetical protein